MSLTNINFTQLNLLGCEKEEDEENPTLTGEQMKQRLMSLHRLLAPQEADPYQVDVER